MNDQKILMQRVSKISDDLKEKTFDELLKGFQAFSVADYYILGYKKEGKILVYKIPSRVFYKLAFELLYLNNSSDAHKTLALRLHRYSNKRIKLLKKFYIETFSADELKGYKSNQGRKFETFIENKYNLIHNEKDAIQYGGVDAKKDGINYQIKLEAASLKMFREWYECNNLFIDNGWV